MNLNRDDNWLEAYRQNVASYRRMIDAAVDQLSDEELQLRPAAGFNSVAILMRHLGGNLTSRWTDFLVADGEKPDRDRDAELSDWTGDRKSLMEWFDAGWAALNRAIDSLDATNINQIIYIRGEPHSIPQALLRSLAHIAYHVGQLVMIARWVHQGDWKWLTIAPESSTQFNQRTWGTSSSRGIFGHPEPGAE